MAYPTPTIYTYRVREVKASQPASGPNAYYIAEFSTNSGTTWLPLNDLPFGSKVEANQYIANVVNNEAKFQKQFLQAKKFANPKTVPTQTIYAYPPV